MDWQNILKRQSILEKVEKKQQKKIKKLLQHSQPTEFMGQDMTKLTELITEMKSLDLVKADNKMKKQFDKFDEKNLDIVASASELRKDYELLYKQLRGLVYPKSKGDLK